MKVHFLFKKSEIMRVLLSEEFFAMCESICSFIPWALIECSLCPSTLGPEPLSSEVHEAVEEIDS